MKEMIAPGYNGWPAVVNGETQRVRSSVAFHPHRSGNNGLSTFASLEIIILNGIKDYAIAVGIGDHEIGALDAGWNHLVDVQDAPTASAEEGGPPLLHWTLGGPWFREQRTMGGVLAAEWFGARDDAMKLWD